MIHRAAFTLDGPAIAVACADGADHAWLVDNLVPGYGLGAGSAELGDIAFVRDGAAFDAMTARGPHGSGERVACFTLDTQMVRRARWTDPDGLTVFDDEHRVFFVLSERNRSVRVVARPGDRWARVAVLRVVREILSAWAGVHGYGFLHAAAIARRDDGIAIAGRKRSGKTSLLSYLAGAPGVGLLANDRVAFQATTDFVLVRGVPTIVNVRAGTIALFRDLYDPTRAWPADVGPGDPPYPKAPASYGPEGSLVLSPARFAGVLGVERAGSARLRCVVLPEVVDLPRGIVVRRLRRDEAVDRLADVGIGPATRCETVFGAFARSRTKISPDAGADPRDLADLVPCIACSLGPEAYAMGGAGAVFDRLLAEASPECPASAKEGAGLVLGLARPGTQPDRAGDKDSSTESVVYLDANDSGAAARILALARGRPLVFRPGSGPLAPDPARRLDVSEHEVMPLVPDERLPTHGFVEAHDASLGWALTSRAAGRLLPTLGPPSAWTLAGLYGAARAAGLALRWRAGPLGGEPAPATDRKPALHRRSRVIAVVPHHRCEAWLAEALRSLTSQVRPPDAIAVVDDGSASPPIDICAAFPSVSLYRSRDNVGPYRLVHSIIARTDHDAILFQDADDWSCCDRLALLLGEAERSGAELIGTQEIRATRDDTVFQVATYPADVNAACRDRPGHTLLHPTSIVARRLVRRLGGLSSGLRFSGDTELLYRSIHAARVVNVPAFAYVRRDRPGSLTTATATGLQSTARAGLLERITERACANAENRRQGRPMDLSPLDKAAAVRLTLLSGPEIRVPPRGAPRAGAKPARRGAGGSAAGDLARGGAS